MTETRKEITPKAKGEKMAYKNPLTRNLKIGLNTFVKFKNLKWFVLITTLLFASTLSAADINGPELHNILREKDQIPKSAGYKVSFQLEKKASRLSSKEGIVIEDCNATWTAEGSFAMKKTNYYEKDIPVFAPLGTENYMSQDYDSRGNLIVWRDLESYILFTPERNDRIQNIKLFIVDPNGKLVREGDSMSILHRYPIGNRGNMYEFDQFQLAMGRGFSKEIQKIISVERLPSGLMHTTAQAQGGMWELTIDPNEEYLIRKGIFTKESGNKATTLIVITSDGVIKKDGLIIGKHGTYKYSSSPEISFDVTDVSKIIGHNELYEEVFSYLNSPLPKGSSIVDLRGDKPVKTTVK